MSAPSDSRPVPHRTARFAGLAAHLVGGLFGLACGIAYDSWFWLKLRGAELGVGGLELARAHAFVFALALPAALFTALALAAAERLFGSRLVRYGVLLRPQDLFTRAPDEVADSALLLACFAGSVLTLRAIVSKVLTTLHADGLVATLIALVAPFAVLLFVGAFTTLRSPLRRFVRGLDAAACPALLHGTLLVFTAAGRTHFAETSPALDRALPWYVVYVFVLGGLAHLLVAGAMPRRGAAGIRLRWGGLVVGALLVVTSATAVFTYGRSAAQRFFVEEISWIGSRAYRAWSEALDGDGDGYPSLLAGRDCNDRRRDVHPGAVDVRGDGIDSDCFGGDQAVRFTDLGDGNLALESHAGPPPNVLLISIDTMRPDRLAAAGNRRGVAPHLDALQREAVWFRNADAPSPRTTRSLPSVFSGQHPGMVRYNRSLGHIDVAPEAHLLAEMLHGRYDTFAILGTSYFRETPGLLQGFGTVEHAGAMKPDPSWVTNRLLESLDRAQRAERPFFGWVHYFNPHEPYLGDGYRSKFGNTPQDLYDTEIWRADEQVGRVLDHLRIRGLDRNTVVVVFSDHGESLGERGTFGHSTRLNHEQLASVLMIRAPSFEPRIVDSPVGLFDLMPTVLDLTGTRAWRPMSARSLVPAMRGLEAPYRNRPVFAEILPDAVYAIETQSVRLGQEKLIHWPLTGRMQYFDLARDPLERRDVQDRRPDRVAHLRDLLLGWDTSSHLRENHLAQVLADARVASVPVGVPHLDAEFANGVHLIGAKVQPNQVPRDGMLQVDLYFRPTRPIPGEYFVHLTFEPADGNSHAAGFTAHHTAVDGAYPTSRWRPGEIIRDTVTIRVPSHVQPNVLLVARVELWAHFHVRMPVAVVQRGIPGTTVDVGTVTVQ